MKLLAALSIAAVASAQHFGGVGYARGHGVGYGHSGGYGHGAPIRHGVPVGYHRLGAGPVNAAGATAGAGDPAAPAAAAVSVADAPAGGSESEKEDKPKEDPEEKRKKAEADMFNLSQQRYKLDHTSAYEDVKRFDSYTRLLDVDVDPAIGFWQAQRYQDAYAYNIDRIQEAIDNYHRSGKDDPHALVSLQLSLDAEHHRVDSYRWNKYGKLIPEIKELQLGQISMVNRRRADHEMAQHNLHQAYDKFSKGDIDAEKLWKAEHSVWVEAQEEKNAILRLLGSPSSVFGIPTVQSSASERRLAEENLWDVEDKYYREPTRENYEALIDAELKAEEKKYANLAWVFQTLGNGAMNAWAWWNKGKASQILNERKYNSMYEDGVGQYEYGLNVDYGHHHGHGGGHLFNSAHYGDKNDYNLDRLVYYSYLGGLEAPTQGR